MTKVIDRSGADVCINSEQMAKRHPALWQAHITRIDRYAQGSGSLPDLSAMRGGVTFTPQLGEGPQRKSPETGMTLWSPNFRDSINASAAGFASAIAVDLREVNEPAQYGSVFEPATYHEETMDLDAKLHHGIQRACAADALIVFVGVALETSTSDAKRDEVKRQLAEAEARLTFIRSDPASNTAQLGRAVETAEVAVFVASLHASQFKDRVAFLKKWKATYPLHFGGSTDAK